MTAGIDLGDRYSYLGLLDACSGEVIEEGRLRTTPEAFGRRFDSERPMRIAIEAGTHSPWISRLLEGCGHEVLVAKRPQTEAHLRPEPQNRPDRRREAGAVDQARPETPGAHRASRRVF